MWYYIVSLKRSGEHSMSLKNITLFCQKNGSDKVYTLQIDEVEGGYMVIYANGKRGAALKPQKKTMTPVTLAEAEKIFDKVVRDKTKASSGYQESLDNGDTLKTDNDAGNDSGFLPQLLNPIDVKKAISLCHSDNWVAQEKHDGERRPVIVKGNVVHGTNRYGFFTGGLKSAVADGIDSSINMIADTEDLGSKLAAFDLLEYDGKDLRSQGFLARFMKLQEIAVSSPSLHVSPVAITTEEKLALFEKMKDGGHEGVVFKFKNAPYTAGKVSKDGDQLKFKFYDEASVVVIKVNDKRSVQMGVYDQDMNIVEIGNVTIPANKDIPLVDEVIQVRYLYAYQGGSLYQPAFERVRHDQRRSECKQSQLKYKRIEA